MKIDMFMHSEWFGQDIYVSPNGNIYVLYPFDNEIKLLVMDEDMTQEQYLEILHGNEKYYDEMHSEVMVYWMYVDGSETIVRETIRKIVTEYEEDSEKFFKNYNTKNRN